MFYRSIGINLKQLYGTTETSVFVCVQPDGHVRDDTVGPPVEGVDHPGRGQRRDPGQEPGLFKEYYRNPRPPPKRATTTAGSTRAMPATWTTTASSRSSTAPRTWASWPTAAYSRQVTSRTS